MSFENEKPKEREVKVTCDECGEKFWIVEWMFLENITFGDPTVCPACSEQNTCRNQDCPYWDLNMEEGCGKPESPSDDWIYQYCEDQPSYKND